MATKQVRKISKIQNAKIEMSRNTVNGLETIMIRSDKVGFSMNIHSDGTMTIDIHPEDDYTNVTMYETDKTMPQFKRGIFECHDMMVQYCTITSGKKE